LTPDQRRLLDAARPGALAIECVLLVEDMDCVKRTLESEPRRLALLTWILHALKTPLAFAASTMRDLASNFSDSEKRDLLTTLILCARLLRQMIEVDQSVRNSC
jgi:K+-sensing histidine kinase KdpD